MTFLVSFREPEGKLERQEFGDDASFVVMENGVLRVHEGDIRHHFSPSYWLSVEDVHRVRVH